MVDIIVKKQHLVAYTVGKGGKLVEHEVRGTRSDWKLAERQKKFLERKFKENKS